MARRIAFSFLSGFLATILFHQAGLLLFWKLGLVPAFPWDLTPNQVGVPKILSVSFFGGLWGIIMLFALQRFRFFWMSHIIFGAVLPTLVALLVVFPLKNIEVVPQMIPGGLILNGLWGFGAACFFKLFRIGGR